MKLPRVTGYEVDQHGYQLAQWDGKPPRGWRVPTSLKHDPEHLVLLHWADPDGINPTTEICIWNDHGGGQGAWMVTSGRDGAELPRLDGGDLFAGFKAEKRRRPGMKGVRLIAWQALPYPPLVEHDEADRPSAG